MNAPQYIRAGNLVVDLLSKSTIQLPSINAAKRHIRTLKLPPRGSQSMIFHSKNERNKIVHKMHKQLVKLHLMNGRTP